MGLARKTGNPGGKKAPLKVNPFDLKVSKPKFDVLNRDGRGIRGAPALAKQRTAEIRQATLLPELARRGRTSAFVDRRFGERDRSLSNEEKMLERFSKVKQSGSKRSAKKSIFNLNDDGDDHGLGLTHLGRDLEEISEFSDPEEGRFDHDAGRIDSRDVRRSHFGGFQEDPSDQEDSQDTTEPKSRAEVMKEVMAKSKFYKAERQRIKEENEDLCNELDQDFSAMRKDIMSNKYDRTKEVRQEDDYDALLKTMLFDRRSKPTDRMLTAEEATAKREAAQEAKEARMKGCKEDDSDSDVSGDEARVDKKKKEQPKGHGTEKDEERARELLGKFCDASTVEELSPHYVKLVEMSQGPASVALGRAIRSRLGTISRKFKHGRPFFPSSSVLMLFHLIGRIYSTSDFHHVIASPSALLMMGFLEGGRMTRPKHLLSALFIAQTLLHYERDSKRFIPEVFNLVRLLLSYHSCDTELAYDGLYNGLIKERIEKLLRSSDLLSGVVPLPLGFDDLKVEDKEFTPEIVKRIYAALLHVIRSLQMYADLPSFPELMEPIVSALGTRTSAANLAFLASSTKAKRRPLALQHHKPIALPMLTPDIEQPDKEERNTARLKAALKRETKGAKREIRRDNQFLARHEATERKRKDQEYKQMINRVYGTIANDGASERPTKKRREH